MERIDEHRAEPAGTLRLNLPPGAGRMVLSPLIFEYMRRYPRVAVDMVTEGAMVDIVGQGFDAGVRLGEFVPPDMIAVPITRPIRFCGYDRKRQCKRERRLTWRSTAAFAGARGTARSTAGSLKSVARLSQ